MSNYSAEDVLYLAGAVGRGIGAGIIIVGLARHDMETIVGGIGLMYAGQCFYKSAQDNVNTRKQVDVLRGIEAKLKE